MFNLTVAIHIGYWVRSLQHLVFETFIYIGFDNSDGEFVPLYFKKTSPSNTLSFFVVVLQENGAEVPGGVSR